MTRSFDRMSVEQRVQKALPSARINGNVYHDPYRLSVSAIVRDLIQEDQDIRGTLEALVKDLDAVNVLISGPGEHK